MQAVTTSHFSTLSWLRKVRRYPPLAMRQVLKERSVHRAPSLHAFERRAVGAQSRPLYDRVIALCLCTVLKSSVKTVWKSPPACMISDSFCGHQYNETVFFISTCSQTKKDQCPDECPEDSAAQTSTAFWGFVSRDVSGAYSVLGQDSDVYAARFRCCWVLEFNSTHLEKITGYYFTG